MCACLCLCTCCVCVCVCVCNAKRQLNLLPLIVGIPRPREKTHPISCDMAVTSCRPVFMDAVPVTLLISCHALCVCVCVCVSVSVRPTESTGSLVALVQPSWWVDYWDKTWMVSASTLRQDWETCVFVCVSVSVSVSVCVWVCECVSVWVSGFTIMKTKCPDNGRKMWAVMAFVQMSAQGLV